MQQLQPLCRQLDVQKIDSRCVAGRPRETGNQTQPDRVFKHAEDDGNCGGCRLGRQRGGRTSSCGNHGDVSAYEIGSQFRQPIELSVCPAIFNRHILALGEAGIPEAAAECAQTVGVGVRRCGVEKSDHRHRRLLRTR